MTAAERKAAYILGGIAAFEGTFVALSAWRAPLRFLAFIGFAAVC